MNWTPETFEHFFCSSIFCGSCSAAAADNSLVYLCYSQKQQKSWLFRSSFCCNVVTTAYLQTGIIIANSWNIIMKLCNRYTSSSSSCTVHQCASRLLERKKINKKDFPCCRKTNSTVVAKYFYPYIWALWEHSSLPVTLSSRHHHHHRCRSTSARVFKAFFVFSPLSPYFMHRYFFVLLCNVICYNNTINNLSFVPLSLLGALPDKDHPLADR